MQEIVDEVIKTEEKAARIIAQAREKASQIKTFVDSELNDVIKKAKENAQSLILEAVADARNKADTSYESAMKEVEFSNKNYLASNESRFDSIVDKIISIIKNPDYDRE